MARGGVVAMFALLVAGPARAQTSGGATATGGSVASGEAHASNNSTASGESTASNNSTASGCSTATTNSTASGDDSCGRPGGGGGGGGATTTTVRSTATTAGATTARLAVTGSRRPRWRRPPPWPSPWACCSRWRAPTAAAPPGPRRRASSRVGAFPAGFSRELAPSQGVTLRQNRRVMRRRAGSAGRASARQTRCPSGRAQDPPPQPLCRHETPAGGCS